jgi:hypothetical protein
VPDTPEPTDPLDGGPVRHLRRVAPPWAVDDYTVCGRPIADVARLVEYDEAKALVDRWGQARAHFLFCQTCLSRHGRKGDRPSMFATHPAAVTSDWAGRATWVKDPLAERTRAELLALADLVERHREEYDATVHAHLTDELRGRRTQTRRAH